jgi:hypothetical protein
MASDSEHAILSRVKIDEIPESMSDSLKVSGFTDKAGSHFPDACDFGLFGQHQGACENWVFRESYGNESSSNLVVFRDFHANIVACIPIDLK